MAAIVMFPREVVSFLSCTNVSKIIEMIGLIRKFQHMFLRVCQFLSRHHISKIPFYFEDPILISRCVRNLHGTIKACVSLNFV